MDSARFDSFTRSLTIAGSRRRILTITLSSALGLVFEASSVHEAVAKKKCPPCKKRKHGKCKKNKPDGTPCIGGTCRNGQCCIPTCATTNACGSDGCGGSCGTCSGNRVCINGTCFCPPERSCAGGVCCPTGQVCAGGVCQGAGTCQAGQNICTGTSGCNGSLVCDCLTRFTDNALICGNIGPAGACVANCTTDEGCASFGTGAFCAKKVGDSCCASTPLNQGICGVPC
jgi:hypothetical protein